MARTVTTAFKEVWARRAGKAAYIQIRYKRRYWNGAAYVYESDYQVLSHRDFAGVGPITSNLDVPDLNVFKASEVTLRLNDPSRKWVRSVNSPSIFAAGGTVTGGYDDYLCRFNVRWGYLLDSGSVEYVDLFTGFATEYRWSSEEQIAEVVVKSPIALLESSDAAQVADFVTNGATSPAAGDGVTTEFRTVATGVGTVEVVREATVAAAVGVDVTVSDLDNPNLGALLTFAVAPANLAAIDWSGRTWKAGQTLDAIVGLLCDEAGIDSSVRSLSTVIFPGGLSARTTYDSESDWTTGATLTNVEATSSSGEIKKKWVLVDDFTDGDYTSDPAWSYINAGGAGGYITVSSGKLRLYKGASNGTGATLIALNMERDSGTWRFKGNNAITVKLQTSGANLFGIPIGQGYLFIHDGTNWVVYRDDSVYGQNNLASGTLSNSAEREIRITRTSGGVWEFSIDLVVVASFTDVTYSGFTHVFFGNDFNGTEFAIDDFYVSDAVDATAALSTATALWTGPEIDLGSVPIALGTLDLYATLNGGTVTCRSAGATSSGGAYEAFVDRHATTNVMQSSLRQFLKIQVEIEDDAGSLEWLSPAVNKLVANYTVSTITLSLAIHAGKTAWAAIEDYAKLADYEAVFDAAGVFYFRSKTVTPTSILSISGANAIASVSDLRPGYDEVITAGQVQYNEYWKEYDGADAGEASPTSEERFGRRIRFDDMTGILLANDVDIATSRARLLYENYHLPMRTFRLSCKIIPWLELGDVITVSFYDSPLEEETVFGDPLAPFGTDVPIGGPDGTVLLSEVVSKVIGITYNPDAATCELICREVLS